MKILASTILIALIFTGCDFIKVTINVNSETDIAGTDDTFKAKEDLKDLEQTKLKTKVKL